MSFASLVLIQFFKAYNYRSDQASVWHKPFADQQMAEYGDRLGAVPF